MAYSKYFKFRQAQNYRWSACLGDCKGDFGFDGGIRELVLLHRAMSVENAKRAKNMVFTYNNYFKAYFRFNNEHNKFEKDEFVDRSWVAFKGQPESVSDYLGVDIIPNDVCPSLFKQKEMLQFDGSSYLDTIYMDYRK